MRLDFFFLVFLFVSSSAIGYTQHFFPVKLDKKWGLINTDGKLVQEPIYDAIGEFKHFGYAVMQKKGAVGLLGPDGKESLEARYDDIKVLSKNLIAVMLDNEWSVINPQGQTVLDKGYARVRILQPGFLIYQVKGKWGLVKADGRILAAPKYDKIEAKGTKYFQTKIGDKIGLLSKNGRELLACIAAEIRPTEQGLIFYRKSRLWGAIDQ
ncbi:MAG: WG repeat-containing protein, partial [Bacteroidota bacterium]